MWKYYLISCSHQDHISPRRNIISRILKDFPLCSDLDCLYNNDFLTFKVPPCCVFEPLNSLQRNYYKLIPDKQIPVSTGSFVSCSLIIRCTNMRTSHLIFRGSAESVIDTNTRNYCVCIQLHTTAVETSLACANV